jgi:hypothetical protein
MMVAAGKKKALRSRALHKGIFPLLKGGKVLKSNGNFIISKNNRFFFANKILPEKVVVNRM